MTYENVFQDINALKREIVNWDADFYADIKKKEATKELVSRFNPDVHVVVTKDQLDLTNHIKAFAGMANKIEQIESVQSEMAKNVEETHAVHTGKYFKQIKKEKPLTKKQREELEIQEMRTFALNKALSRIK